MNDQSKRMYAEQIRHHMFEAQNHIRTANRLTAQLMREDVTDSVEEFKAKVDATFKEEPVAVKQVESFHESRADDEPGVKCGCGKRFLLEKGMKTHLSLLGEEAHARLVERKCPARIDPSKFDGDAHCPTEKPWVEDLPKDFEDNEIGEN